MDIQKSGSKRLIIGLCYSPPAGDVTVFQRELCNSYDYVLGLAGKTDIIIKGDFNINYADKKSANFEKLCVLESKYSLKQLRNRHE